MTEEQMGWIMIGIICYVVLAAGWCWGYLFAKWFWKDDERV